MNSNTADIPKGSKALPAPVLEAYKAFLDATHKHNVPLRALIESPDAEKVRLALDAVKQVQEENRKLQLRVDEQAATISGLRATIRDLEKKYGEDEL